MTKLDLILGYELLPILIASVAALVNWSVFIGAYSFMWLQIPTAIAYWRTEYHEETV